ncbi:hypothetical protein Y032_0023g788 [Ancylostoma ceylanicum]|nr:hypothetical protein Y032_0023g788 [Ancylostoma ceylanicum]
MTLRISGRYNDPVVAANTFKEDGGIIITIEYVQVHGAPVPMLDTLASPGYALTNRFGRVDVWELHKLFCKANCFCPTNYKPYKVKGDLPYGGCYKMSTLPAIQALAQRSCRRHFNGSLTTVETLGKAKFLTNMMRSNASFWIGLRYNNQAYRWTNGNAVTTFLQPLVPALGECPNNGCLCTLKDFVEGDILCQNEKFLRGSVFQHHWLRQSFS